MNQRRAKIIGTVGPATRDKEALEGLLRAGVDVIRLNMSHGSKEDHKQAVTFIREVSKQVKKEVAILMDLQGPKIRVDNLDEPLQLKAGEKWYLGATSKKSDFPKGSSAFIPTVYEDLVKDCVVGSKILFDDGLLEAKVTSKQLDVLEIEILEGGVLKSNKGINLPDVAVSAPSLTAKDKEHLHFGVENQVDYIALSFVRSADDIKAVQSLLHEYNYKIPVVAKIERPEAVEQIESIVAVADVIMIARGDMGVELGNHLVPSIQKRIIELCNSKGVPVITATQMLESMIHNAEPTRAEASDVANAVWDGSDALMLSGETAVGSYPLKAVKMMDSIIKEAELTPKERPLLRDLVLPDIHTSTMMAASLLAEKVGARYIFSLSEGGNSLRKLARFRPRTGVIGVSSSLATIRKMSLYWGVSSYLLLEFSKDDEKIESHLINVLKAPFNLHSGDKIVVSKGEGRFFDGGTSNSLRVTII